jgi:hypothetical protein
MIFIYVRIQPLDRVYEGSVVSRSLEITWD